MNNEPRYYVSTHTVEVDGDLVEYTVSRTADWPTASFSATVTNGSHLYDEGYVLAELLVSTAESDLGLVDWVWVEPSARRRGVATVLYSIACTFYDVVHDSLDNCNEDGAEWSAAVGGPRREPQEGNYWD